MFLSRCKTIAKLFFCLLAFACAIVGFRVFSVSKLSHLSGERLFYLYSPSSQATIKPRLSILDCFFVQGESVRVSLDGDGARKAEEIIKQMQAELLFTEEAGGVLSYYAYAKNLGGGIVVSGTKVNLHIAVADGRLVVGTPIIFGGF